jgi:Protein of unknown function (DUF4240)
MTLDDFWAIVDRVHAASGGDMDKKCELLEAELSQLPVPEIISFEEHFRDYYYRAHSWDLWGAAYLITKGNCGDDSFMDFRSTLISMGRKICESALENPDSLADANIDPNSARYEGYQYVVSEVLEKKNEPEPTFTKSHRGGPTGTRFNEWAMEQRYPRLTAKYGYKDADYEDLKKSAERGKERSDKISRVIQLLLDAQILPPSGIIPPFKVLAAALRRDRSDDLTGKSHSWEPVELTEGDYWLMAMRLEGLKPHELQRWPYLQVSKLKLDVTVPPIDDYSTWLQSIKTRGLAG